ncbi:Nn.00g040480.m01.CDS01 [Neocucurbitaria sp. VM-36]
MQPEEEQKIESVDRSNDVIPHRLSLSEGTTSNHVPSSNAELEELSYLTELRRIKKNTEDVLKEQRKNLRQIYKHLREAQTKLQLSRKKHAEQKAVDAVEGLIRRLEDRAKKVKEAIKKFEEQEQMNEGKLRWVGSQLLNPD